MKQQTINITIVLSLLCVLAVLFSQGIWIRNSLAISESNFDYSVNEALKQAVAKMEKQKVYKVFSRYTQNDSAFNDTDIFNILKRESSIETDSHINDSSFKKITHKTEVLYFETHDEAKMWEHRIDSIVDDIIIDLKGDSLYPNSNFRHGDIDSNIKETLAQNGIYTEFEYAIKSTGGEIIIQSDNFNNQLENIYKTAIYPNSVSTHSQELLVQIPQAGKNRKMWSSSLPLLLHSTVFVLFILITFWLTIRTILKQKKLSIIKNDFINNMTHEFKTPIATISIAADALQNAGISAEQTQHFAEIIKQESRSMNQKVETILQMALVEQQQVQLEKETISANPLVQKAIQHLQLRLEASGAELTVNYLSNDISLYIDAHHISNVLGNIIDNAIKYSKGTPHISIGLAVTNAMLTISIADKGIGMSKEEQKHVFDKFYRAQSGNVHNTKGFGLGLSYAREIIQLHKGQIDIDSEKGEGTTVSITLPIHGHNG